VCLQVLFYLVEPELSCCRYVVVAYLAWVRRNINNGVGFFFYAFLALARPCFTNVSVRRTQSFSLFRVVGECMLWNCQERVDPCGPGGV
jgi:hypothetical protein